MCIEKARQNAHNQDPQIRAIIYAMLSETGQYDDPHQQVNTSPQIHGQLIEIANEAWEWIRPAGKHHRSWTKIFQKANELYIDFIAHLKKTIEKTVVDEETRQQLLKLLA